MADDPQLNPSDALSARISEARQAATLPVSDASKPEADLSASRLGAEFAAAILASAGLGLLLDRMLGTKPWGILLLLLLGFAAGLMAVWRGMNGYGQAIGFRRSRNKEDQG